MLVALNLQPGSMTLCHLLSITVQNLFYSPDSVQFVLSTIYILFFFMFFVNSKFAPSLFSSTMIQ